MSDQSDGCLNKYWRVITGDAGAVEHARWILSSIAASKEADEYTKKQLSKAHTGTRKMYEAGGPERIGGAIHEGEYFWSISNMADCISAKLSKHGPTETLRDTLMTSLKFHTKPHDYAQLIYDWETERARENFQAFEAKVKELREKFDAG
jgi:hypothetical protein